MGAGKAGLSEFDEAASRAYVAERGFIGQAPRARWTAEAGAELRGAGEAEGSIRTAAVSDIRFGQRSASVGFAKPREAGPYDVFDFADALKSGRINPETVEAIRVTRVGDQLYAVGGNRRLLAFQMAGIDETRIVEVSGRVPFSRLIEGGARIRVGEIGIWDPMLGFL